jgi:hypothetical protein
MTDEQRAAIDPSSREYYNRVWGSKIQVAGWSLYAMVLWLVKFSLAVFYSRLTCDDPSLNLLHLNSRSESNEVWEDGYGLTLYSEWIELD